LAQVTEQLADQTRKYEQSENEKGKFENQLKELRTQLADAQTRLADAHTAVQSLKSGLPVPSAKRFVDAGTFRFASDDCVRTGTKIQCSGSVTNLGSDPESLHLRWYECYLVDNFHNQLALSDQIFKLGDGTGKALQPNLPVAFNLLLEDKKEDCTHITLILSVAAGKFPSPMERNEPVRLEFSVRGG
jgi:hypothetical protein